MSDDMQIKGKHDRPLYFTGYIGSSEVSRIQVDPGSALSIMPRRVMQHLGIPTHWLSATQTTIYGFDWVLPVQQNKEYQNLKQDVQGAQFEFAVAVAKRVVILREGLAMEAFVSYL